MFKNVVLVGPMGAGKTTIGRLLAKELHFSFFDSDKEIEARSGADIPWIFDVEGEEGFRVRESQIIDELVEKTSIVLATGGGAVMKPENRESMTRESVVVYLKTSVDQQFERTYRDRNRPLLQQDEPRSVLENLFEIRDPLYESVADITVTTDKKNPRSVVRQIVGELEQLHR